MPELYRVWMDTPFTWTYPALCPQSKYRNTGIAFTIAVGINKPSADAPSAMADVWELLTTQQKPY